MSPSARSLYALIPLTLASFAFGQQPNVRLTTQPITGTVFRLAHLGDAAEPTAFDVSAEDSIWRIVFSNPQGNDVSISAADPNVTYQGVGETGSLTVAPFEKFIVWLGANHAPSGIQFSVVARIRGQSAANVFEFDILVDNHTTTHAIHEVEYPRIQTRSRRLHLGHPSSAGEVLAVPNHQGNILVDPVENIWAPPLGTHTSPGGLSMQWMAYYDDTQTLGPVLFFGSRDPRGIHKEYVTRNHWGGNPVPTAPGYLGFSISTPPEGNTILGNDYNSASAFPVVVGVVRGDWVDGANEYRNWLMAATVPTAPLNQRPVWMVHDDVQKTRLEPLSLRPSATITDRPVPPSVAAVELFLTIVGGNQNHFGANRWQIDQDSQRQFFQATNTITTVYGWHNWDWNPANLPAVGDWFPAQPDFATSLRPAGIWAPYVNIECLDDRTDTWSDPSSRLHNPATNQSMAPGFNDRAHTWMARDRDQNMISAHAPTVFRPCPASTNGANARFIEAVSLFLADQSRQDGAKGLYLDETSALASAPCHANTLHGHAPGGGSYQTEARRDMMLNVTTAMQALITGGDFHLQSEAPNEVYSDLIHIAHEHAASDFTATFVELSPGQLVPFGKYSAPLYAAVYHDYQHTARIGYRSNNWANVNPSVHPLANYGTFIRRGLGFQTWFGDIPSGGSDLRDIFQPDIAVNRANPNFPEFVRFTDMLKRVLAVTKHPLTRATYHVGRRVRDPVTTVGRVSSTQEQIWIPWQQGSADIPKCFVSAWEDEPSEDFGVFLVNWTASTDSFGAPNQSFDVTLDLPRMGLAVRSYVVTIVTSTSTIPLGVFDFTTLPNPFTFPVLVNELDGFYIAFDSI